MQAQRKYKILRPDLNKWDTKVEKLINKVFYYWAEILCLGLLIMMISNLSDKESTELVIPLKLSATVSTIFAGILFGYVTAISIQFRREKFDRFPKIHALTQKVHNFRRILNMVLTNQEFWPDNFIDHMRSKYNDISYFELRDMTNSYGTILSSVKDFYGDSKYGEIKQFYLEIRVIVQDDYYRDGSLYSDYEEFKYFHTNLVRKWSEHDCGNGLWYFFEYSLDEFTKYFNFGAFSTHSQANANRLAKQIDSERFKDFNLSALHLSHLGSFMNDHIMNKLLMYQERQVANIPSIVHYSYCILSGLLVFGVILPILLLIYEMSANLIQYCIAITTIISLYIILTFYKRIKKSVIG